MASICAKSFQKLFGLKTFWFVKFTANISMDTLLLWTWYEIDWVGFDTLWKIPDCMV